MIKLDYNDYIIDKNLDQNNKSYIYGEVYPQDIYNILKYHNLEYKTFIDIGSGNGKLLYYLSQNTELLLEGIEIDKNRYNRSIKLLEDFEKIFLVNDDYKNIYFGNYDIIYCCNTVFEVDENNILYDKIENEFSGIFILYEYNQKLKNYLLKKEIVKTSWNKYVPIYIFSKV